MTIQARDVIAAKRDGLALDDAQIRGFLRGYTDGDIPDYQAAALLMAIFLRGLDAREFATWTDAMLHSGVVLDLSDIDGYKVDKHSTGGVGDKISLPLAPLVAVCGARVPMISGRGLGHTGGTLDKLESIPGFTTGLSLERFRELVGSDLGCGLIGQTEQIAPADRKLYALRDATATIECIPLIASSIMSKKLAEGIDGLVLDVKTGSGAFMRDPDDARELARAMVDIGRRAGRDVVALVTDMSQPLGTHIGNSLEVIESIDILRGEGPDDVRELTLLLGVEMLRMAEPDLSADDARARLETALSDGSALQRFADIVEAQGGDPRAIHDPTRLPAAPRTTDFAADRDGVVTGFDCADVGRAAMRLGAGRERKEDDVDPAVGLVLRARRGDRVVAGQPLATIHHRDGHGVEACRALLATAIHIGDSAPEPTPLVLDRIA